MFHFLHILIMCYIPLKEMITVLVALLCDLAVAFICISLMTNGVENLFMCLLATYISFWVLCSLKNWIVFFLSLLCCRSFYIFWMLNLPSTWCEDIFSHFVSWFFHFVNHAVWYTKVFFFIKCNLSIFVVVIAKNILSSPSSRRFTSIFSSKSFTVLLLILSHSSIWI